MRQANWEEILWRAQRNECSPEELEKIQLWLNASSGNRRIYEDIGQIATLGSFLKGVDSLHKTQALNDILKQSRRRKFLPIRLLKYAALFLLPLVLSGTLIYFFKWRPSPEEIKSITAIKQIMPGAPKAILYLSDGQAVDLNNTPDSVIIDGHSGEQIMLSKIANALNYSHSGKTNANRAQSVYNKIVVPRGGEYLLVLSDGTKVWLNSETQLEYPLVFGKESRDVRLSGEAFFEVAKEKTRRFNVIMPEATIEVTGTSFNASCYPEEEHCSAVLEQGKINLLTPEGTTSVRVGECASYDIASGKVNVEQVDMKYFTSWRYGTFYFYNTPLSDIVKKLERWYDVEFRFADDSLREICFSGAALRNKPINFILRLLESTQSLKFNLESDGTIMIDTK